MRSRRNSKPTFSTRLFQVFYLFFFLIFSWIVGLNFLENSQFSWAIYAYVLGLIVVMGLIGFFAKAQLISVKAQTVDRIFLLYLVVALLFITYLGLQMQVDYTWDFGVVHRNAYQWATTGQLESKEYFARYPNNNLLLVLLASYYKIVNVFFPTATTYGFGRAAIALNSLFITSSIGVTYLTARRIWSSHKAFITVMLMSFFMPLFLYAGIFYTDTFGVVFVVLPIYLYVCFNQSTSQFRYAYLMSAGLIGGIGYRFKAFVLIILLAVVIDYILKQRFKPVKSLLGSAALLIPAIVAVGLSGAILDSAIGLTKEDYNRYQFPTSHWLMMALEPNGVGSFNEEDVEFTHSFDTLDEKKRQNNRVIKERLEELGPSGLLNHVFVKKLKRTWATGSLGIDDYGGRGNLKEGFWQDIFIFTGTKHKYYRYYAQASHLIVLLLLVIASVAGIMRRQNPQVDSVFIGIFGVMLFLAIWECNSRYVYTFIPLLALGATEGLSVLYKKKRSGHEKQKG